MTFALRFVAMTFALGAVLRAQAAPPSAVQYNRDIRPIISENCFACHGADSASRKAKLRLDSFEEATAKRGDDPPVIIPGKPDESEVIRRIFDEGDDLMPPEKSHKVLTVQQKELLKRWVAEGAKYEPHWSFIAPVKAPLPKVRSSKWVRNPIDAFILARLESEKLKPAPEADRRTLARRVSLDLTGLPPAPEDVAAFVKDRSPDAYEKFVDQLLASPHWGEHRGRYWLDAARYADSNGIHFDNFREMWTYRDWVINACNTNMPFDRFTIENLAGDLIPNATREQKIASGFNRCNSTTSEGGAIDEEYQVLYARDRTDTTAQVWLGMTAGCAVCHDHKYDPLSQKEFYQLSAFFNNTTQPAMDGNIRDTPPIMTIVKPEDQARWDLLPAEISAAEKNVDARRATARPDFEMWETKAKVVAGILPAVEPGVSPGGKIVDSRQAEDRLVVADKSDANSGGGTHALYVRQDARRYEDRLLFHAPLDDGSTNSLNVMVAGQQRTITLATNAAAQHGAIAAKAYTTSGQTVPTLADVGDFERTNTFSCAAWVWVTGDNTGAIISRMTGNDDKKRGWDFLLDGGKPAFHLIYAWPYDAMKVIGRQALPTNRWAHVALTYNGTSRGAGVKFYINGQPLETVTDKEMLTRTTHSKSPFMIGQRDGGTDRLEGVGLQDVRIYGGVLRPDEVRHLATTARSDWITSKPAGERTKEEGEDLFSCWLATRDAQFTAMANARDKLAAESEGIRLRSSVAHVMNERPSPAEAFLLFRGQYDQRRDKLSPETPKVFPPMPADLPRNRLGFAKWLVRPEHPLTARVTVNRYWQELFGTGLVRTTGDFGVAGEMPSHPELLDWLAVEFRESGWDVKKFFKLLVTSATYRQSAVNTPEKLSRDPQNRLLAHGPRFRMDGEMVRDTALAASGLLVPKIGGPSVKPYQPDGVWAAVAMPESNTGLYERDSGENLYRRSVYTLWKRAAPPASLEVFNAPSRETCTVRRERTDTPLQALVTMNDPQFVEAARNLAERALKDGGGADAARIDFMAERLIARPLKPAEKKVVADGLKDFLAHYKSSPKEAEALVAVGESKADANLDKPTLAAYTMVANQLMNLDEVLNK